MLPLFGSIAGSESLLVAFEDDFEPSAIMAEAAHGTAPSLKGKNVANPMAMILAGAALLSHGGDTALRQVAVEADFSRLRPARLLTLANSRLRPPGAVGHPRVTLGRRAGPPGSASPASAGA